MFHENEVLFLALTLDHMHYGAESIVDNIKHNNLELELQNVVRHYAIRGFNIILLMVETQFKPLKYYNKAGPPISEISRRDHVSQIE